MTERTSLTSEDINFAGRGYPVDREKDSSLPYGINANRLTYTEIDLSTARNNAEINISGNVLAIFGSSSALSWAEIRLDEYGSSGILARDGLVITGVAFRKLWLTHDAQRGMRLRIMHGVDPQVRFNVVPPPAITPSMAHNAGYGHIAGRNVNASVGQVGALALVNPAGSGVFARVHRILCVTDYYIGRITDPENMNTPLTFTPHSTNFVETGLTANLRETSQLVLHYGYDPTTLEDLFIDTSNLTGREMFYDTSISLAPGDHISIRHPSANTLVRAEFTWYELPLRLVQ